jgi:hypothetical protein
MAHSTLETHTSLVLVAAIGLSLAPTAMATGTERLVPQQYASIQSAIDASTSGDTVLVAPGTYHETIRFNGKNLAVRSTGGALVTTIARPDAAPRGPTINFDSGESPLALLEGFTVSNGNGVFTDIFGCNCDGYQLGGGIHIANASPTVRACVITLNGCFTYFSRGGGIYVAGGSARIESCQIKANYANGAYGSGGGVHVAGGSPVFVDCVISANSVTSYHYGDCGGIAVAGGSPTFSDCRVTGNSSSSDVGGMCLTPSTVLRRVYLGSQNDTVPYTGSFTDGGGNDLSGDCNDNGIPDHLDILNGPSTDVDADGMPDECLCRHTPDACCPADIFRDGVVNGSDLGIVLAQWGQSTQTTVSDINDDGYVDGKDLATVISSWGPCP